MQLRIVTDDNGELWVPLKDIAGALRATGEDYLQHIPGHTKAGEFLECILDRHADFILGQAADNLDKLGSAE